MLFRSAAGGFVHLRRRRSGSRRRLRRERRTGGGAGENEPPPQAGGVAGRNSRGAHTRDFFGMTSAGLRGVFHTRWAGPREQNQATKQLKNWWAGLRGDFLERTGLPNTPLFFGCKFARSIWSVIQVASNLYPPCSVANNFDNWLHGIDQKFRIFY